MRKGRSSAPSLKREIRFIGGLALAGELLLRCLYIPSEDNPADAPSRGIVRKHHFVKQRRVEKLLKLESLAERDMRRRREFLAKIEALPDDDPVCVALRDDA